jgi:hypothetical protein
MSTKLKFATIKFKDWDKVSKKLKEDLRKSQQITAKDLAVIINCKD